MTSRRQRNLKLALPRLLVRLPVRSVPPSQRRTYTIRTPIAKVLPSSQYMTCATGNDLATLVAKELQQPPRPIALTGNKKALVWGVGHPDAAHCETWVVKAHANKRGQTSVYVGTRRQMGQVKLSIHEGCWQYAFTSEAAPRLPAGMDRRLATFTPPKEVAPGWRRAAVILIPSTTLSSQRRRSSVRQLTCNGGPCHLRTSTCSFTCLLESPIAIVMP
jgi:hypothetical protein